jgi:hypothetical protein
MFEIDLDSSDEGTWFQYQESRFDQEKGKFVFDPPNSDAKVQVRRADKLQVEQIAKRKRVREIVLNPKTRRMESVSYIADATVEEEQKEIDDLFDYAITGLEGFKNKRTGEVIECNRKNKIALMKVPAFDRFLGRCFRILGGIEEEEKEEEEKN